MNHVQNNTQVSHTGRDAFSIKHFIALATFPGIICCHVSSRGDLLLATDHVAPYIMVSLKDLEVFRVKCWVSRTALARVISHRTFFLCRPGNAFSAPSVWACTRQSLILSQASMGLGSGRSCEGSQNAPAGLQRRWHHIYLRVESTKL